MLNRKIFYPFFLPHLFLYYKSSIYVKNLIKRDIIQMNHGFKHKKGLLYYLAMTPPYRNMFNFRMGRKGKILKIIYPQYSSFYISSIIEQFGGGACVINHPYGTIINAKSIGSNFTCCQLTTIGNKQHWNNECIPSIGDNVSLGANVTIIGNIKIGSNVIIGAGSVVVKDIPDNVFVAGNPAKILYKTKQNNQ